MGKNGLKLRIKKLDTGFAVEQRLRRSHILYWHCIDVKPTLEECVEFYPYTGVERSANKLREV